MMISIRPEEARDYDQVRAFNLAAFEGGPEADLVDTLRSSCAEHLSLVAEDGGDAVGHILFTPVTIESPDGVVEGMGLVFDPTALPGGGGVARYRDEFDTAM